MVVVFASGFLMMGSIACSICIPMAWADGLLGDL